MLALKLTPAEAALFASLEDEFQKGARPEPPSRSQPHEKR
jgi:hypothetical protein